MKRILLALSLLAVASIASAANLSYFTGPTGTNPANLPAAIPDLNALIASINGGVTPQSMASPLAPRNLLDNGAINISQRGTAATAGATTGGSTSTTYVADRWWVDTNVTSGAGYGQVVTSPTPPSGFQNSMNVYRNSGSLTQPVCAWQEVPTADAVALQGQTATFSFYAQALAGMNADNGNVVNAYIIYGTGSDEGFGTLTASPAITPAWTGINSSITGSYTLSASVWNRYTLSGFIPTTAKEVGVAVCFTPAAGSGGSTDGFSMTGLQLEQGAAASTYEFRDILLESSKAGRYYWQFAETVSGYTVVPGICSAQSSTVATCNIPLAVMMRKAPTVTCTFGTMKRMVAGTDTALTACAAAATTNGVTTASAVEITATVASGDTAGFSGILLSGNSTGGGLITASADF
jgi:hypothetical protein